jgi:hypothetical protein
VAVCKKGGGQAPSTWASSVPVTTEHDVTYLLHYAAHDAQGSLSGQHPPISILPVPPHHSSQNIRISLLHTRDKTQTQSSRRDQEAGSVIKSVQQHLPAPGSQLVASSIDLTSGLPKATDVSGFPILLPSAEQTPDFRDSYFEIRVHLSKPPRRKHPSIKLRWPVSSDVPCWLGFCRSWFL